MYFASSSMPFRLQDIVGAGRPLGDHLALLHEFTLEHRQIAPLGNQRLVVVGPVRQGLALGRGDHQAALALGLLAEADGAGDLRQDGRLLRLARLEQVGHAGQTTGDVPGLGALLGNPRDHVTRFQPGSVFQAHHRQGGQEVVRRHIGVGQAQFTSPLSSHQAYRGTDILARSGTLGGIHHRDAGQAGQFVGLTLWMVMPSSIPLNFTVPATSVMIGWVCGSQLATISPADT